MPNPGQQDCPVVNREINRFKKKPGDLWGWEPSMYANHQWTLLEEIVHYYLAAQTAAKMMKPEVYSINKAWALKGVEALGNAVSYAYHAAGEFFLLFFFFFFFLFPIFFSTEWGR